MIFHFEFRRSQARAALSSLCTASQFVHTSPRAILFLYWSPLHGMISCWRRNFHLREVCYAPNHILCGMRRRGFSRPRFRRHFRSDSHRKRSDFGLHERGKRSPRLQGHTLRGAPAGRLALAPAATSRALGWCAQGRTLRRRLHAKPRSRRVRPGAQRRLSLPECMDRGPVARRSPARDRVELRRRVLSWLRLAAELRRRSAGQEGRGGGHLQLPPGRAWFLLPS